MSWWGELLGVGGPEPRAEITNDTSGSAFPESWLTNILGGLVTSSGMRVTPELAQSVPGVSACVNVIAEDLAKIPLEVFRRVGSGGTERATEHPLYKILKANPCPWLTSYNWRRTMVASMMARGNHFSRVFRDGRGEVVRVQPLRPSSVVPSWTPESEPFYDHTEGGYRTRLYWQDVIHAAYRADSQRAMYGGVVGVSPIERHADTIALAVAAERFAGSFFKNGARPSAVIEMERKLPDKQVAERIRTQIERLYSGTDNAFKIAVLEMGMKLNAFSFSNSDSQLVEVRKESAVQMCQIFGVPPHKVGILDRATFSNIENQAIEYVTGPISSLAKAIESAITLSCLTDNERDEYFVEFNLNGLLRGDIQSRYRAYAIGRQWGWLNVDQIREWENLDPLPDELGKTYLTPMNMAPAGWEPDQAEDAPQTPQDAPKNPPVPPGGVTLRSSVRSASLFGPDGLLMRTRTPSE